MTTWKDIKRSETPFNWRQSLKDVSFTKEELVDSINKGTFLKELIGKVDKVLKERM